MDKYQFKPVDLVVGICRIYINFKDQIKFYEAVSRDGRSYSDPLMQRAKLILIKFYVGDMINDFHDLAEEIKNVALDAAIEDEATDDAPEAYLDALMSTLMKDPVLLPQSKNIVDRSTISRHILSDQFDPFSRQPLTMDMVIPQPELKLEIQTWLSQWKQNRKRKRRETSSSEHDTSVTSQGESGAAAEASGEQSAE